MVSGYYYQVLSIFCASATVRRVPEAFCIRVCPSVSASVRPEKLVNTISQKTMKGISPNFDYRRILVHRCAR